MLPINIRPYKTTDTNFILNSWLLDSSNQYPAKYMHYKNFNVKQSKNLVNVLAKSQCLVAVSPEDDDFIFGFLVFEQQDNMTVFHFIFTKDSYRDQLVAKRLVNYVFPDFGNKECIFTQMPKLNPTNYQKYQLLNEEDLKSKNLDVKFANVNRFYLMYNKIFFDQFIFYNRCFK